MIALNNFLTIWLKANLVFALLTIFFALVLRKETLHYFKRLYLLSIPLVATIVPFIHLKVKPTNVVYEISETVSLLPFMMESQGQASSSVSWELLLFYGFLAVSIFLVFYTLFGLHKVYAIIGQSSKEPLEVGVLCNTEQPVSPFSFFQYIVVHKLSHQDYALQQIIEHEQVHVYQKHFIDMLLAQITTIVCWLNPAVWFYRHYVVENLEFIVDQEVLRSGVNKKQYQFSILNTSVYDSSMVFANHFNQSLIKKRIQMMNKKLSNPNNMWKAIFVLPILLVLFSVIGQVKASTPETVEESSTDVKTKVNYNNEFYDISLKTEELENGLYSYTLSAKAEGLGNCKSTFTSKNENLALTFLLNGKSVLPDEFLAIKPKGAGYFGCSANGGLSVMMTKNLTKAIRDTIPSRGSDVLPPPPPPPASPTDSGALPPPPPPPPPPIQDDIFGNTANQFYLNAKQITYAEAQKYRSEESRTRLFAYPRRRYYIVALHTRELKEGSQVLDYVETKADGTKVPHYSTIRSSKVTIRAPRNSGAPPPPPPPAQVQKNGIYDFTEVLPEYPGGTIALRQEIQSRFGFPESLKTNPEFKRGAGVFRFVVEKDGSVNTVKVIRSIKGCIECNENGKRILTNLNHKFKPGTQAGKAVRVWYTIPIVLKKKPVIDQE